MTGRPPGTSSATRSAGSYQVTHTLLSPARSPPPLPAPVQHEAGSTKESRREETGRVPGGTTALPPPSEWVWGMKSAGGARDAYADSLHLRCMSSERARHGRAARDAQWTAQRSSPPRRARAASEACCTVGPAATPSRLQPNPPTPLRSVFVDEHAGLLGVRVPVRHNATQAGGLTCGGAVQLHAC
eukprot:366317-Chlamydomonas_euryale.AAC.5